MFKSIISKIKKVVANLFSVESLEEALGIDIEVDEVMLSEIAKWKQMYQDKSYWADEDTETLNLPATISSEIARLVTLELSGVVSPAQAEGEIIQVSEHIENINEMFQKAVMEDIKANVEYSCALGGGVLKPYIAGNEISVSFYLADEFIPIRFDSNGQLVGVVFPETKKIGDKIYTKLEYHDIEQVEFLNEKTNEVKKVENVVVIRNYCFVKDNDYVEGYGKPASFEEVPEWAGIETEAVFQGVTKPLFGYIRMPSANQIEMGNELGVSVFSKAEKLIKLADETWDQDRQEFRRSEKKTFVDEAMIRRDKYGNYVDVPNVISVLDTGEPGFYKEFNPEIRHEAYSTKLNEVLRRVEFNTSLAYGTLSRVEDVAKTATEIKASRQRSFALIADIQKSLENALIDVVDAMVIWYKVLYNVSKVEDYQISFDFDDSLVVDNETEQKVYLLEVQAGIRTIESYLKEMYNYTDEQIKETIPGINLEVDEKDYDDME